MDWSDDELVKMAENESERLAGDVDPAECEKVRRDYLAKRWPFLFGEAHGKTLDDVVYESYDQSPNFLKRLDDLTDSAVSCGMSAVEDCYFSAPRSKYQAATPRPAKWHRDAIDDHKIYFSGNQEAYDRLFWIAKMYPHNQQGRNLRGVVRHFLVENVHPKDSIADIFIMLGGRFDESRGDTLQFHTKESYIREIGTRVIELKEQRVGPNKLKLVYPDAWMAKLKAWVDSWPDQNVFENVLIKSSCLPYDHKLAGVPRGSKDAPDWVDLRPPAQTVPVQEEPPKTRFIIKLGETLPSEERNMNLFGTPSVGPLASRRASCEATPTQASVIKSSIPTQPLGTNAPRDSLVDTLGLYRTPVTDEEKLRKRIDDKLRCLVKLNEAFDAKKIFDFVLNFGNWAKTVRDRDGPTRAFTPITKYGQPVHQYDFVRSMFFEVDPLYLRFMIEGKVIAEWQSFYGGLTNVLGNNPSDAEIWEYLLLSTQYKYPTDVEKALRSVRPPEISRRMTAESSWTAFIEQIIYIIRRSTIMPGTDGNPSVVYPAKRFLETINDKTNNQLMDTYIIWIGKFDSSNEKLGDAIYDLGNAFVNKVNSLESSIKDMNLIRIAFGAHAPAQKGRSQSKGPFKNPRTSSRPIPSEQWCNLCKTNKHPEEKCFKLVGRPGSKKRHGGEKRDRKRKSSSNKSDDYTSFNNNLTNNSIKSIYIMSKADSNYNHLNPLKRFRESSNPVGSIHSVILSRVAEDQESCNGELWLTCTINNVEVQGEIDNGAAFSALSMDLASKCNMTVNDNKTVEYLSANGIRSTTLGCASGVLALNVGSLATQVFLRIEFQIIPGTNNFLIGRDLLQTLGLRTEHGFNINLDREHRTILNAECEFDNRICQPIRFIEQLSNKSDLGNDFGHSTFRHELDELGCRICLDDIRDEERLVVLLEKYRNVFSGLPHPDGIDCQPMTIPFYGESKVVKRKPRRLNPEKQRVAEEIFNELIRNDAVRQMNTRRRERNLIEIQRNLLIQYEFNNNSNGFAVPAKSQFSSPICLVIYPDHRKPRLTGDFSGIGGVNDLTKPAEANLPRISDILEFLSKANYITTLDLPKAFWQLKIAEEDIDKTTVSIPGMSISFKRACFGLKNVPAVFQNMMMEIFDSEGVFIYIDDIIIVASTLDEFLSRVGTVLERAKRFRVNLGLPKCSFTTCKHEIKILGSIFVNKTRYIDESRIEGLINLPKPRTLPEVRSFIGSINYIRDWLPYLSDLIEPINKLTRNKPSKVKWTSDHDEAFGKIINLIKANIPLELPSEDKHILISADASDVAVGGVIWQEANPPKDPTDAVRQMNTRRRERNLSLLIKLIHKRVSHHQSKYNETY
ncbi:hypothetical protein P9112_010816 [Eukaryota sp. TZLM1-RC]